MLQGAISKPDGLFIYLLLFILFLSELVVVVESEKMYDSGQRGPFDSGSGSGN